MQSPTALEVDQELFQLSLRWLPVQHSLQVVALGFQDPDLLSQVGVAIVVRQWPQELR
jgi:hypothetical protein